MHFLSFFWLSVSFFIKNCRNFFWQVYQNWNQSVTMTFFESHVETAFRLSDGTYWGRFFFERVAISHVSCLLDFIVFGKSSEKFGSVVENGIHMSWETNWRQKVLQKTWKYLIIILLEQLNLGLSGRKLSAGPPKLVFTGHVGELEKFYGTFCLFLPFCDFQSKYFGPLSKKFSSIWSKKNSTWPQDCATLHWEIFGGVAKPVFYLSSGTSWGCFFSKGLHFHNFLGLWVFCFWHFVKKFPQHCPNCHIRVLRNKLKKKNASNNLKNFDHHLTWRMKSWAFWPKSFSRAAKTRFCGSSWTIWEIFQNNLHFTSFSVFQSTFSGLLAQFFWQVCQKWILSLRRIVRRPLKKLSAALSKLRSICPV